MEPQTGSKLGKGYVKAVHCHPACFMQCTSCEYKKDLHDPDNHNGVITHLEPDILECKVKWALGSITTNKASGSDGIPVELFQILKRCCESATLNMSPNLGNSAVATGLEKVSFLSNAKERQCQRMHRLPDNCTNFTC